MGKKQADAKLIYGAIFFVVNIDKDVGIEYTTSKTIIYSNQREQ